MMVVVVVVVMVVIAAMTVAVNHDHMMMVMVMMVLRELRFHRQRVEPGIVGDERFGGIRNRRQQVGV